MLVKYAIHLLVATACVLASPLSPATQAPTNPDDAELHASTDRYKKQLQRDSLGKREEQANCGIRYRLKQVPSVESAALIPGISKWWSSLPSRVQYGDQSVEVTNLWRYAQGLPGVEYQLAHAYEPYLLKNFFNILTLEHPLGGSNISCEVMQRVFGTRNSGDSKSRFTRLAPAQVLANELSCFGTNCPSRNRAGELFLLMYGTWHMKQIIMSGRKLDELQNDTTGTLTNPVLLRWNMIESATAFDFMNLDPVVAAFVRVNQRIRSVLDSLDSDSYYQRITPPHIKWRLLYDKWLAEHYQNCQRYTFEYLQSTGSHLRAAARDIPAGTRGRQRVAAERERDEIISWVDYHQRNLAGKFTRANIAFRDGYPRPQAA